MIGRVAVISGKSEIVAGAAAEVTCVAELQMAPISKRSVLRTTPRQFCKEPSTLIIFDSGGYFDPCTRRARGFAD
jgi:hypothetical protein